MIVSKDGRVWIRRGIPRVVFSFPSRGRGINNRTRERERESLPIIPRPALFYRGLGGRQLISGSTFRCTSIAISSFFCSITGQQMRYIYIYSWLPLLLSSWFLFRVLELQYIYQRLIRIPQASWRDCKQLRFLRGPLFAFAEINSRRTH